MAVVTCSRCGRTLPDEAPDIDQSRRQPCPNCGSRRRTFQIQVGGNVELRGSVNAVLSPLILEARGEGRAGVGTAAGASSAQAVSSVTDSPPPPAAEVLGPEVLIAAELVNFGGQTAEGQLVIGVSVPWFEIVAQLARDSDFLSNVPWRKLEELIAGAFERDGWDEVVLTPRSGDRGRDVIASKRGVGAVRIIDQVKH